MSYHENFHNLANINDRNTIEPILKSSKALLLDFIHNKTSAMHFCKKNYKVISIKNGGIFEKVSFFYIKTIFLSPTLLWFQNAITFYNFMPRREFMMRNATVLFLKNYVKYQ